MGAVHVRYFTDPACPWSWAAEPGLRRLQVEFGADLSITYVMAGLAREFLTPVQTMREVIDAASLSGMPVDPRLWLDHPPRSSYPASQGVKAAAEQGLDGTYLRVLREGFMVGRRSLDTADALVDAARQVEGMNVERFGIDLRSHAIVEAFSADLDRAQAAARDGDEPRVPLPSFSFTAVDGVERWLYGETSAAKLREAAIAAGATPQALPSAEEAVRRFGRVATAEIAAICDLPGPRAPAELWRLALEWRVRPEPTLMGELWTAP